MFTKILPFLFLALSCKSKIDVKGSQNNVVDSDRNENIPNINEVSPQQSHPDDNSNSNSSNVNGSVSINSGAVFTNSKTIQLEITSDSAVEMYITNIENCESGGTWKPFSASINWDIEQINREVSVYVKLKDKNNNFSTCISDHVIHDSAAPILSDENLYINDPGELYTHLTTININSNFDDVVEIYVSNNGDCDSGGIWQTYSKEKSWTIVPVNNISTVYIKLKDQAGNVSECVSRTIRFSTKFWNIPLNSKEFTEIGIRPVSLFSEGSTIYGLASGTLVFSKDYGITWTKRTIQNGLPASHVNSNLVNVFVYDGEIFTTDYDLGFSRSTNEGKSFTQYTTDSGLPHNRVNHVFKTGESLYVATSGGLAISTNNGVTWTTKTTVNGLASNSTLWVDVNQNNIYVGTVSGLSISTNGGTSWTTKTTAHGLGHNAVKKVYVDGTIVHVATSQGLSTSVNGGSSFINQKFETVGTIGDMWVIGNNVYVQSGNSSTGYGIYVSNDQGSTWSNKITDNDLFNSDSGIQRFAITDGKLFSTNSSSISVADLDGTNSVLLPTLLESYKNINGFAHIDDSILASGAKGLFVSRDKGENWNKISSSSGYTPSFASNAFSYNGKFYVTDDWDRYFVSSDLGETWNEFNVSAIPNSNWITDLFVDQSGIYLGTDMGLVFSNDNGNTWIVKDTSNSDIADNFISSVYRENGKIYLATSIGYSIWDGVTWQNSTSLTNIEQIIVHNKVLYAGTTSGVSISTDLGINWTEHSFASLGLSSIIVNSIRIINGVIYACSSGALVTSSDGGENWTVYSQDAGLNWSIRDVLKLGSSYFVSSALGIYVLNPKIQVE